MAETVAARGLARDEYRRGIAQEDALVRAGGLLELNYREDQRAHREQLLAESEAVVAEAQRRLLACQTECRQVETLVEEAAQQATREVARRAQQMLDDWYGRRGKAPGKRTVASSGMARKQVVAGSAKQELDRGRLDGGQLDHGQLDQGVIAFP